MNAELWVQSPRLLKRKINFLRYNKRVAEGQWAVMDVSVDGILGPPAGSRTTDAAVVANNTTGCRLLPSGCLIEDMGKGNGYCKITCVVHAEYDETMVPTLSNSSFRRAPLARDAAEAVRVPRCSALQPGPKRRQRQQHRDA
ncbi:homeobox-leucine zipper protein ROC6 isoform X2 [Sorghum bicolor]|uniref:homeobox-leucine zipper protein ROC6 isoform X2 n=1 Tax=Sorghum bicolor TaxID=4558 RepID=UPI000B4246E8|nr:homeobox-leucine zipper protein ROC6 isoform X2 [Sorghum bicolor]|eukprot:XP_021317561.1 homeobox-leucine zipper protein ROC6 isoform X2 [Sorghum bicolor]